MFYVKNKLNVKRFSSYRRSERFEVNAGTKEIGDDGEKQENPSREMFPSTHVQRSPRLFSPLQA